MKPKIKEVWDSKLLGLLFVSPQLILVLIFYIIPILKVFFDAFTFVDPFGIKTRFAGLGNFIDLGQDYSYFEAIKITIVLIFAIVIITTILGLLLALTLQTVTKGRTLYKMLLLWPYAVSPAIAAILWRFILHPSAGWLSEILTKYNLSFNYFIDPFVAKFVIVLVAVWQLLSYNVLFFFIALEGIPQALIEAAKLDGANSWQRFWNIRFPIIKPTIWFLGLINALYACFDTFSVIDILTSGGPGNQTTTLLYKIYKDGFLGMDFPSAAAQSILLMAVVIFISVLQQGYKNFDHAKP
ncbi:MAG: hypothetical protein A3F18_01760 [Legionellales bacterium RIFCSPHIGHO2_12_FULL_37_14]|nr:MAG: hypothetical protein A3F18_01760 [Legionellales bacterium RIFCSPHIGHO2_12_FULL_37_14]